MKTLAVAALMGLTACSVQPGELADAGSTAVGLGMGLAEANPALAWAGPAAPVVGLVGKQVVKEVMVRQGHDQDVVDSASNTLSWGATISNIIVIGGGSGPFGLAAGLLFIVTTWDAPADTDPIPPIS